MKIKNTAQFYSVFILAFLLNFLWESIHAVLFYKGHANMESSYFVRMILYASAVDAILILLFLLLGCIFWQDINWLKDYSQGKILFTLALSLATASLIEIKALYLGQWSYNKFMPTILGIGASPLIQLATTGFISMYAVSRCTKHQTAKTEPPQAF